MKDETPAKKQHGIFDLERCIDQWINTHMPEFEFRQYQKEYIIKTLTSIINGNNLNIVNAPTGSGKSILVIIMAGVLDKYYHKNSFILCSDLYLWQQYAEAIQKFGLYFGYLKGSKGNYKCSRSKEDLQLGACRLAGISYANLMDFDWCMAEGWECATTCKYMIERKRAIQSHVTLMTYQLYFHYMNKELENNPFPARSIIFCDECHNIPNLCQSYGAIDIDYHKDISKIHTIFDFSCNCLENERQKSIGIDKLIGPIKKAYDALLDVDNTDKQGILKKVRELSYALSDEAIPASTDIINTFGGKNGHVKKKMNKREITAYNIAEWLQEFNGRISDYIRYSEGQPQYIVKNDNKIYFRGELTWPDNPIIGLKYAKEDMWVNRFLLNHQSNVVMLSATVGDKYSFDDNIGTMLTEQKQSTMFTIPSTFDFSRSPIYFVPGRKMSTGSLQTSLPANAALINSILSTGQHMNEKGIIHTGSYKIANELYDMLNDVAKRRVFVYSQAKDKEQVLKDFVASPNGVLIGPTLLEGIDLPDDGCRFIIFLKIPYPSLGDNLVLAKKELFPKWYLAETSNSVIQGIGRGNRTPNDWCTTYILDGCFESLYRSTASQYPVELRNRIQIVNI